MLLLHPFVKDILSLQENASIQPAHLLAWTHITGDFKAPLGLFDHFDREFGDFGSDDGTWGETTQIISLTVEMDWFVRMFKFGEDELFFCAERGLLDRAKMIVAQGGASFGSFEENIPTFVFVAAKYGQLDMLVWARQVINPWDTDWDEIVMDAATRYGHVHVVQWARSNGSDWSDPGWQQAAKNNHFEMIKWLHANGCPLSGLNMCIVAATNGNIEMLEWARQHAFPFCGDILPYFALKAGHLHALQWLIANGCPWSRDIVCVAASNGHVAILDWIYRNFCVPDSDMLFALHAFVPAIDRKHLNVVKWFHANGFQLIAKQGMTVLEYATFHGHLDVIVWARQNGYRFSDMTAENAYGKRHWHVLDYVVANGCKVSAQTLAVAKDSNSPAFEIFENYGLYRDDQ
jgi:hypothetical protein